MEIDRMMTFFKIVFVILILIPIGLLMKYLLGRLSLEVPKQADSVDMRPSPKKKKNKNRNKNKNTNKSTNRKTSGDRQTKPKQNTSKPKRGRSTYTPRQPEQWERSERVPFGESEGFRVPVPERRKPKVSSDRNRWEKPSDAVRERTRAKGPISHDHEEKRAIQVDPEPGAEDRRKGKNRKPRSEKKPSKRQLRKNRERARKRDMKKRREEKSREGGSR